MSMQVKKLHALSSLNFVPKVGKYVAEIQFHNFPKQTLWLSEKQAGNLNRCMKDSDYSTRLNEVWVVLDMSGSKPRYVWADCNDAGRLNLIARFGANDE